MKIKLNEDKVELRHANWVKMLIDLVKPANLYLYGGRGLGKSTEIIAERSLDVIRDLPRACFAFVSDTYVNAMTNIIPAVLLGWERKNYYEGRDYMVDKPPLPHWDNPYIKTFSYKHTISTRNGCKFFITSLDRPSANAGISVVHHFGDEAKYLNKEKLNKLFPTLRGDTLLYTHSPYFMGQTFCSDMANPESGEYDWMMDMRKRMDRKRIMEILQVGQVLNDEYKNLIGAQHSGASEYEINLIKNRINDWSEGHRKIRFDSTLFFIVSSFAASNRLPLKYYQNLLETLGLEEFKTSVLSIPKTLTPGAMFYGQFKPTHVYQDGYNYEFYDQFNLKANIKQSSEGLRYINTNKALEAGFDTGNMMSLVIGQEQGDTMRILKDIYTLTPEFIRALADKYIEFFRTHKRKELKLWCDRAAYQYKKSKEDFASKLKHCIEYYSDGKPTGWLVTLVNLGQPNITHGEEYDLMNEMMGENNRNLPKIMIDAFECKELIASIKLAPMIKNSKGMIEKVKKSEKLPVHRLPLESTNMSDAFKYLICRKNWLAIVRHKKRQSMGNVSIRG
jgi:hypothetical protein